MSIFSSFSQQVKVFNLVSVRCPSITMCIALATNPISSVFSAPCLPLARLSAPFLLECCQIISGASQCCYLLPSSLPFFLRCAGLSPPLSGCCSVLLCRESSPLPTGSQIYPC